MAPIEAQSPETGSWSDSRLEYLANLDVDRTKKSVLLALITLEPEETLPVKVDLESLEQLLGIRRGTLRRHLRSLHAVGILSYLHFTAESVSTQITYEALKAPTANDGADQGTAKPGVTESTREAIAPPGIEDQASDDTGGREAPTERRQPDADLDESAGRLPPSSVRPTSIVARHRPSLQAQPLSFPGVTSALTMALAILALVLQGHALATPTDMPLLQLLGWGGLSAVALSNTAMPRYRPRFAWRIAFCGWLAILGGAGIRLLS